MIRVGKSEFNQLNQVSGLLGLEKKIIRTQSELVIIFGSDRIKNLIGFCLCVCINSIGKTHAQGK